VEELDPGFPRPTPSALAQAAETLASLPDGALVLVDGLALGAMPSEVAREADRLRLAALIHHPLARETGLSGEEAAQLFASEQRALAAVRRIVVTSRATSETLADSGVDRGRIRVVEPGTDRAPLAVGSGGPSVQLLCVATLIPRKGYRHLLTALARLVRFDWRLTCAGSLERHVETTLAFHEQLQATRLQDRVVVTGDVDAERLAQYYDRTDVFVLPTLYEGYGMAVAEALARGLPVVSTATGAIPDLLAGGAGRIVPPGDVDALTSALAELIESDTARRRCAAAARAARERLPTWDAACDTMAKVLEEIARG
jgi:glycosyltransferase involved in cell wall biosynthesis